MIPTMRQNHLWCIISRCAAHDRLATTLIHADAVTTLSKDLCTSGTDPPLHGPKIGERRGARNARWRVVWVRAIPIPRVVGEAGVVRVACVQLAVRCATRVVPALSLQTEPARSPARPRFGAPPGAARSILLCGDSDGGGAGVRHRLHHAAQEPAEVDQEVVLVVGATRNGAGDPGETDDVAVDHTAIADRERHAPETVGGRREGSPKIAQRTGIASIEGFQCL